MSGLSGVLTVLKTIGEYLLSILTFPVKLFQLLTGFTTDIGGGLIWLPANVVLILVSILALAVIFKVFGREG